MNEEILKCAKDIRYFAEKYVLVHNPVQGFQNFTLNSDQLSILEQLNDDPFVDFDHERQTGATTLGLLVILHKMLFEAHSSCVIIGYKMSFVQHSLYMLKEMYESIPEYMRASIIVNNRNEFVLENGSRCTVTSSECGIRGRSLDFVFIDEADFVRDYDDLLQAVIPATIASNGKVLSVSSV